ncbi:MAG TPA: MurT ligase domain-containing protein [Chloroflexota bacterium]|nr:MurT ligase domain-containing protein [Chloroflexota bacterium]
MPGSSPRAASSGAPAARRGKRRRPHASWRLAGAVLAGRAASALSRRLGRGGGTVIAGHVVPRLAPGALRHLSAALPDGVVLVSGTNGKTTTARLLAQVLAASGRRIVHNRAGANLLTGIVSALVQAADLRGRPRADVGLFEVDEATLPHALPPTRPRVVVLTNIFRDQLDRYGEVHYVAEIWRRALAALPPAATLVLNADDPLVASLGGVHGGPVLYYGVELPALATPGLSHAADARLCPACGAPLVYARSYYGHLGDYRCSACAFARPSPAVVAVEPAELGPTRSTVQVRTPAAPLRLTIPLPGLYNVYNALAATAGGLALGIAPDTVAAGLAHVSAAFGRLERIAVGDRAVSLALIKNPVGCTEVLRTLTSDPAPKTLLVAINDLFADGTDVSWLWDADFELLDGQVATAVCSGTRAADMALRLKYALVEPERLLVEPDVARALHEALARTPAGGTLYVLPTYTALLALREALQRQGVVAGFWED